MNVFKYVSALALMVSVALVESVTSTPTPPQGDLVWYVLRNKHYDPYFSYALCSGNRFGETGSCPVI